MRIISGLWGGRRIQPPVNMPHTRPTTDIAKEGLFNIITNNLDLSDLKTLDLFGGTGCISYELASRGAKDLTIVERDPQMHKFIVQTFENLGFPGAQIIRQDVFQFLMKNEVRYDFIFAGPPYALREIDDIPRLVFDQGLLNENGWFILEHTPRNDYKEHPNFRSERKYGTTIFSIFVNRIRESV